MSVSQVGIENACRPATWQGGAFWFIVGSNSIIRTKQSSQIMIQVSFKAFLTKRFARQSARAALSLRLLLP
jgi:hypothetical protein